MAIHRKKRYETPVKCSICKEKRAHHTVHGYQGYRGCTCCDECYPAIKADYEAMKEKEEEHETTEGEYQAWRHI